MGQRREISTAYSAYAHTKENAVFTKKPNKQTKELGLVQGHLSHTFSIAEAASRDKPKEAKLAKPDPTTSANKGQRPPFHAE